MARWAKIQLFFWKVLHSYVPKISLFPLLFCGFCLQLWESALKLLFVLFFWKQTEVCLVSCPIVKGSNWVTESLISYSSLFSFSWLWLVGKAHWKDKNATEIPGATSAEWSIMWASRLALQFIWSQWNEQCLKRTCSWWLLNRCSCVFVQLECSSLLKCLCLRWSKGKMQRRQWQDQGNI